MMNYIIDKINAERSPFFEGDYIIVPTDCCYPDGVNVRVRVYTDYDNEYISIDDDNNAINRIIEASGVIIEDIKDRFKLVSRSYGVNICEDGKILLEAVSIDDVPPAISLVANASVALVEKALYVTFPKLY